MIGFRVLVGNTAQTRSEHFTIDLKSIIVSELPKKDIFRNIYQLQEMNITLHHKKKNNLDIWYIISM